MKPITDISGSGQSRRSLTCHRGSFVETVQCDLPCPACLAKIILFPLDANHQHIRRCLVPQEGRLAIVTDAGRDAVDAKVLQTRALIADGEVVWS